LSGEPVRYNIDEMGSLGLVSRRDWFG